MAFDAYLEIARHALARREAGRPVLLGISGGVSVGKTTTAEIVRDHIRAQGSSAEILCTDAFLFDNNELGRRGLMMRKGFPESYDVDLLATTLDRLRRGYAVSVPVYSHEIYDRLPEEERQAGDSEVVIVEGVNVLQRGVVDRLDLSVYVDADESHMEGWFRGRFLDMCETAEPGTFYEGFASMTVEERKAMAATAWASINLVNLREHILPSRDHAMFVLRKAEDHSTLELLTSPR